MGKNKAPYRIETERLLLRPWRPEEAARLIAAIKESLDHLRKWMAWAAEEPETLEAKRDRIQRMQAQFENGEAYNYGIFTLDESTVLGGCGLHPRIGPGGFEIGYWIHADHINRGYATEAAVALTRVGFEVLGAERVEIHCDPANAASAAVPRKIGFELIEIADEKQIWRLEQEGFTGSATASYEVQAFDKKGKLVL